MSLSHRYARELESYKIDLDDSFSRLKLKMKKSEIKLTKELTRLSKYGIFQKTYSNLSDLNNELGKHTSYGSDLWIIIFLFMDVNNLLTIRSSCKILANIELTNEIYHRLYLCKMEKDFNKNSASLRASYHLARPPLEDFTPSIIELNNIQRFEERIPKFKETKKVEDLFMPGNDGFILRR